MTEYTKKEAFKLARSKFLGFSLESSRKSYYPQLMEKLEEAKKNEERLQLLIDNLPVRIAYINANKKFVLVNDEYEKVFKKNKEAIIDSSIETIVGEENYHNVKPYIEIALAGNEVHFETSISTPPGETLWNEINYIPVFDTTGEVDGFYVLALDLTEKKRSEDEKKKLELKLYETEKLRAVGTLAGGVAHDFNNLLMGIQGNASLLEVNLDPSNPLIEYVQAISEHVKSATSLTRQLLGFSRGGKYEVKPIDINRLVLDQSTMFGRTRKEISIHHKLDRKSLVADLDQRQMEQVLLNLFVNAWQAMPDGGDLLLETKTMVLGGRDCQAYDVTPGSYACILVTDTGIGMSQEIKKRAFDPFFTTREKQRGTGLGLASAYGIIKNHGGGITVYSEVSKGATFTIYLPLSQQRGHREKTTVDRKYIKGTGTVLLVDDEKLILDVGQAMLEALGYTVFLANSGQEGISSVSDNNGAVDLVILDMIMPGMDGGEAFDRIRDIDSSLPVILSSGYSLNDQADSIIARGCNGFLQKPFNISDLSHKLAEVLTNRN